MVLSLLLLTVTIFGASATDDSCALLPTMVDIGEMDAECCASAATTVAYGISITMTDMLSMLPECFAERLGEECLADKKTPAKKAADLAGTNLCCKEYGGSKCEALVLKGAKDGPGTMNTMIVSQMDVDSDGKIDVCHDGTYECAAAAGQNCDTYVCPSTHSLVSNAATTPGNDEATCCTEAMCNDFTGCGTDKTLITNSAKIAGKSSGTCCTDACSGFTDCPSTKKLLPAAAKTPGNTEATCCVEAVVDSGRACNTIGMMAATSVLLAMAVSSA